MKKRFNASAKRIDKTYSTQNHDWRFNSLPNDNISDWFILEALADDKTNMIKKLKFVMRRAENIEGEKEKTTVFSTDLYCRHVKTRAYLRKG